MRVNLSVALVAMVNYTSDKNQTISDECPGDLNSTHSSKVGIRTVCGIDDVMLLEMYPEKKEKKTLANILLKL